MTSQKSKLAILLAAAMLTTGCSEWFRPEARTTSATEAKELVESMTYVKASNGLCFGVATTSRVDTAARVSMSVTVTNVPCEKVGL